MNNSFEHQSQKMKELLQQSDNIRCDLLNLMDRIIYQAKNCDLPKTESGFSFAREKLDENLYKVLVIGEAKRGKSSFCNGLIGENLLPTDVDISTARVFSIKNAPEKQFRLRFEDGTTQEISQEELYQFGSQTAIENHQSLIKDLEGKEIHWIEAELPTQFLPENICLLDTPGLGAVYAEHAEITQRFVPEADAVIFVLSSEGPILESELEMIGQILHITPNIFFIQTKIDLYDTTQWSSILRRNEDILADKISEWVEKNIQDPEKRKLFQGSPKIWPISTSNLQKAVRVPQGYRSIILNTSRFPELEQSLNTFLYRVTGWYRSASTLVESGRVVRSAKDLLSMRLQGLLSSNEHVEDMIRQIHEKESEIQSLLSPEHPQKEKIKGELRVLAVDIHKQMDNLFGFENKAWQDIKTKINNSQDEYALKRLVDLIPAEIARITNDEWRTVCLNYERKIAEFKRSFRKDLDNLISYSEIGRDVKGGYISHFDSNGLDGLEKTIGEIAKFSWVVIAHGGFVFVALTWATWAIAKGINSLRKNAAMKKNRQSLLEYLREYIHATRDFYLSSDPEAGIKTDRVNEYLEKRKHELLRKIDGDLQGKSKELESEINLLREQQKMDQTQRKIREKELLAHLSDWTEIGKILENTAGPLRKIEEQLQLVQD